MSNVKYEVERLNKTVNDLRSQLFESESENQKLKLELECVLELLKKAWAGDRIASMHITNILNNAEINNIKQQGGNPAASRQSIFEKQQRDALLRSRSEYLNQEYLKTVTTMGSMPVSCNTTTTLSRPSSSVLRRPMSTSGSRSSSRALGLTRRAQSAVSGDRRNSYSGPTAGERFEMAQANERLELFGLKPNNTSTRYDDPSRYLKDGLFNTKISDLKITGKPTAATVPFVYSSQGLQPTGSPRVHANQVVAARRLGRIPVTTISPAPNKRPPSGILAVQDRPLKNEVQYYEAGFQGGRRAQSGRTRGESQANDLVVRPKSSAHRGIRFADDVDVHQPLQPENTVGSVDEERVETPAEDRKRRVTVAIQRRIGISDNALVVPR